VIEFSERVNTRKAEAGVGRQCPSQFPLRDELHRNGAWLATSFSDDLYSVKDKV
jgi:hypothetical protein